MRKIAIAFVLTGLVSFGCGADEPALREPPDEAAEATSSPTGTGKIKYNDRGTETLTSETSELEMELNDQFFEPTFIKLPGDGTVTLNLKNEGKLSHTFTADDLNVDEELKPGATKEVAVTVGTETRYEFLCRFHEAQGMRGAFQPH